MGADRDLLRREAADLAVAYLEELEAVGVDGRVSGRPARGKVQGLLGKRAAYGKGGEWDWLEVLASEELTRLRRNGWVAPVGNRDGLRIDTVADLAAAKAPDDPVGWWLGMTRRVDACRAVASGRRPGRWARGMGWQGWVALSFTPAEVDGILEGREVDETPVSADDRRKVGRPPVGPKIQVRVPGELHARLVRRAEVEGRCLSEVCAEVLWVGGDGG